MKIKIKEISKETFEKNGWDYEPLEQLYFKKFNECEVCVRDQYNYKDSPYECWISWWEVATPDDLIAIGNELKKLEEN